MTPTAVGILGGTFDPVHRGHVALAEAARRSLGLERVLLLPSPVPPHKPRRPAAPAYERLEMLYLAIEGRPGLGVATDELGRGGVCYTIDTLRALRARAAAPVFLIGSDALAEIDTWREHHALLAEFDLGVLARIRDTASREEPPWPAEAVARIAAFPLNPAAPPLGAGGRIVRVPAEAPAVSSRLVRSRCVEGRPITDLVPPRVARYIQRRRLYRQEASRCDPS